MSVSASVPVPVPVPVPAPAPLPVSVSLSVPAPAPVSMSLCLLSLSLSLSLSLVCVWSVSIPVSVYAPAPATASTSVCVIHVSLSASLAVWFSSMFNLRHTSYSDAYPTCVFLFMGIHMKQGRQSNGFFATDHSNVYIPASDICDKVFQLNPSHFAWCYVQFFQSFDKYSNNNLVNFD